MKTPQKEITPLCKNCSDQLDKMVEAGLLSKKDLLPLRHPRRSIAVTFPFTRDDGSVELVEGYRVQYNDALGPTKGGLRMHHEVDLEEVTELAFLMSLKTSLVGLPYGGAKGAIKINVRELSDNEYEQVSRIFIRHIARNIGEDWDIPAPDVNTNEKTMAIMLDEYEKVTGKQSPATFTGKPYALGGSLGRDAATGRGGFYIIEEYFKEKDPSDIRVAIQGFGNVGSHLAQLLHKKGFRVVAVSDSKTGIYDEKGLDMTDLLEWKKDRKSFADRDEKKISNEELLELDVDVLIPAALGGVITEDNANKITAPLIVEMANAPIDAQADEILQEKGVVVIPDILANSGGVIVSYFEWYQNKHDESWTNEKVNVRLRETILPAYEKIIAEQKKRPKQSLRTISYLLAIKRILEVENNPVRRK